MSKLILLTGIIGVLICSSPFTVKSKASSPSFTNQDQPPVVAAVVPNYPRVAKAVNFGKSAEVIIEVEINAKGDVISTSVISGYILFQDVSKKAAKLWRFAPVNENSKIRKARLTFAFSNDFSNVNESDQDEDSVRIVFMPPYRVELRYKR